MNGYFKVLGFPLLVGWLACGGAQFTAPDDGDGGGQGGSGVAATTGTATTTANATATSTATGGAGGSSTTGTGGTGGQLTDAHPDAPVACDAAAPRPVQFRMTSSPDSAFCVNICQGTWITILTADGSDVVSTRGCVTTCSQCQPMACGGGGGIAPPGGGAACAPPQPLPPAGFTYTWDGALWQHSICGPQQYACVNQVCGTLPGKYIARMCANRRNPDDVDSGSFFCSGSATLTCVDVPFEYPATAVVEGVLR